MITLRLVNGKLHIDRCGHESVISVNDKVALSIVQSQLRTLTEYWDMVASPSTST